MKSYIAFLPILLAVAFCIGWFIGERIGTKEGARQMARHILNPAFEIDSFYDIMSEECGTGKGWIEKNGCMIIYKEGLTITGDTVKMYPELRKFGFRSKKEVIDEAINLCGASNGEGGIYPSLVERYPDGHDNSYYGTR